MRRCLPVVLIAGAMALAASPARSASLQDPQQPVPADFTPFTTEQLQQLVGPVALYADPLLAQVLLARGPQQDCGEIHLLRRYERARQEDIVSMQLTTDMLKKLFNNDNPLLRSLRNLGLNATNRIAPLKKMLARHALT